MDDLVTAPTVTTRAARLLRLFAVPREHLTRYPDPIRSDELLEPELRFSQRDLERALTGASYGGMRARDRLRAVTSPDLEASAGSPGPGFGPSAVFAEPPGDLAAVLRLAEELDALSRTGTGERAVVWRCPSCKAQHAVPAALATGVTILCERCGTPIELTPETSVGEEALAHPDERTLNETRRALAAFLREAMAHGWPVLVSRAEP